MPKKSRQDREALRNLKSHPEAYVTIGELASYWHVSRRHIYKQIDAGTLRAIRLGPRLLRIRTADARDFEEHAKLAPPEMSTPARPTPVKAALHSGHHRFTAGRKH